VPGVEQALDDAQLLDLRSRVEALAQRIAAGRRKALAAFPHTQRVLAEPGVAFNVGDGQPNRHDYFCL
jgi:hypothetical protein